MELIMAANENMGKCFKLVLCKASRACNVCYAQSICFPKTMQFRLSQRTCVLILLMKTQTVTLRFAAYRPGSVEGSESARHRQLEKHAQFDAAVSWSTCWWYDSVRWKCVFHSCGGMEGAVAVEQASRPDKAKGTPGWISVRGGWERGEKRGREKWERGLWVLVPGAGGAGWDATSFRRPGVHTETWSNVELWHTQTHHIEKATRSRSNKRGDIKGY